MDDNMLQQSGKVN